jgi:predicted O-methyltransferase YrrM
VKTEEATATVDLEWQDHFFHVRMAMMAARYVPRLPRATLEGLFPGVEELTITMKHEVRQRALLHAEAYVLSLVTAYLRPARIFEIGTASGQGTLLMARQAQDAQIDTLDLGAAAPTLGVQQDEPPWADVEVIGDAFKISEHAGRVTQHLGDSATFDFSPFAGSIDLVFVDGAHTYEYVRSDSLNALSLLRPGGVIVWDDCNYQNPGVAKALLELNRAGTAVYRVHGTRFATHRSPAAA